MNLKKLLEMEDEFRAWEVGLDNRDLKNLMKLGIVKITFKSNKNTYWKVIDKEKLRRLIELKEIKIQLPKDKPLFSSIIGHEKHKELILKAIENNQHILLLGLPSTAKTLFLLELTKLDSSVYFTPYITYSGLFDILTLNPKFILIDQLDNLYDPSVYRLLIDVMEYGFITKLTYGSTIKEEVKTTIIATANTLKRIPEALKSRFLIIRFGLYSEEEYTKIARKLIAEIKPELSQEVIDYIIEKTIERRDIRNALKLARVCNSIEDVDKFKEIIRLS